MLITGVENWTIRGKRNNRIIVSARRRDRSASDLSNCPAIDQQFD